MSEAVVPRSFDEVAAVLAGAAAQARPVRVVGGGSKLGWGGAPPPRALQLHTSYLSRLIVHDDGAGSATFEAGTPLARAQAILARRGVMLAADPQLGLGRSSATVGGVVATADGGPLSHRYGPLRDQVLGVTAVLGDGTLVRTGPRTDHGQHGLELTRLLTGSFGTLGVILSVDVCLRPLPGETATALSATSDPVRVRDAVAVVSGTHPELQALDVAWHAGRGGLLAQLGGEAAELRAQDVAATMRGGGLQHTTVRTDDAGLWARQRAGQRSAARAVLRVHHRPALLHEVLALADRAGATLIGRAALGISYLTLDAGKVAMVRAALPDDTPAVLLDLPAAARGAVDPWSVPEGPQLELMRELKRQHDPAGVCNPGIFVGGI